MCINCYEEAGRPQIVNERTIKAAALIDNVYEYFGAGGYAHNVVDDWNLDDGNIDFCIDYANKDRPSDPEEEEGRQACLDCLNYMKDLSIDERYSAMAIHEKMITVNG